MAKILRVKVDVPAENVLQEISTLVSEILRQAGTKVLEASWVNGDGVPEQSSTIPWRCEAERRFFHTKGRD